MKFWSIIAITAVMLFAATMLRGQVTAFPPGAAAVPSNGQGRFQILVVDIPSSQPEIWIFDTQTADAWRRSGGRWTYMGNPTQDPGTRLPPQPAARGRGVAQPPAAPILPEAPRP